MAQTTSATRRFEFIGGTSDKFWECSVNHDEVKVRYGRNGTDGQVNVKSLPNPVAASKHAEKLVAQKLAKGYVEVS